jgi:hypothetical protein
MPASAMNGFPFANVPTSWEFDSEPKPGEGLHWFHDYPLNAGGALLISD